MSAVSKHSKMPENLKTLVFNGWAAGSEIWNATTFERDWIFSYIEQLDALPEKVIDDSSCVLLVGFSMGGANALKMLLSRREKICGAVLVSPSVRMMEERSDPERGESKGKQVWRGMSERRFAALKYGTESVYKNDPSPLYSKENLDRGLEFLRNTDLRDELLEFSSQQCEREIPIAIVSSERDGIVSAENIHFLKKIFPSALSYSVPGNEHTLPVVAPAIIDMAVENVKKLISKERA
jgi:pimeloyl-ACP methyl ester carboxylesterase